MGRWCIGFEGWQNFMRAGSFIVSECFMDVFPFQGYLVFIAHPLSPGELWIWRRKLCQIFNQSLRKHFSSKVCKIFYELNLMTFWMQYLDIIIVQSVYTFAEWTSEVLTLPSFLLLNTKMGPIAQKQNLLFNPALTKV